MLEYKQIATRIKAVAKLSNKVQDEIHFLLCNIIGHAVEHGNVTLGTDLVNALGNGVRKQAAVTFLEKKGCFRYVKAQDGSHSFKLAKERREEMLNIRNAEAWVEELFTGEMWYDFTPEKVKSTYDTLKMVENIVKITEAKVKKGEKVEHADLVPFLATALKKYLIAPHGAKPAPAEAVDPVELPALKLAVNG